MILALLCAAALAAEEPAPPAPPAPPVPPAPPAPPSPVVTPGGALFAHYGYDLSQGAQGANAFALDRAYLRADARINRSFAARLTLDADRLKATDARGAPLDSKYRVFVKHAYLEVRELLPGIKLRAGMIDTPYTPVYDGLWGNRYIAESFAKSQGLLETADLGIGAWGSHAGGRIQWNASLLNGEGYGKIEVDAGKAVQARLTVDPLATGGGASLPITGFVSYNAHATTHSATLTWAGATGFQAPDLVAWAEVLGVWEAGRTGLGGSVTLVPRLPRVGGILGRYDLFDPDTNPDTNPDTASDAAAGGGRRSQLIAGLCRDWAPKVSTALSYERAWTEGAAATASQGVFLRMQAGW